MKSKLYTLSKTFSIPIGHRLSKHKGLCQNIHGHNFKIKVEVGLLKLNENDMVIDFSELKKIVNRILDLYDHATILNNRDHEIIKQYRDNKFKFVMTDSGDPTAEALAESLYYRIEAELPEDVVMGAVYIWENDDSMVEFCEIEE
jgi:6-pyruvoyltetrahydropterin/6-carboxytetrahydropterin synthase